MKKRSILLLLIIMAGCKSQPQKNGQTVIHADSSSLRWTVTDWGTEVVQPPVPNCRWPLDCRRVLGFHKQKQRGLPLILAVENRMRPFPRRLP